jgi:hypothetical protein
MIKIYKGKLYERDYGESDQVLFIGDSTEPILEVLQHDIKKYGPYLSIRYFIMERDASIQEIEDCYFHVLIGASEATFCPSYSEATGYLYTTEEFVVGGHDVLEELRYSIGYYILLEIEFSKDLNMIKT